MFYVGQKVVCINDKPRRPNSRLLLKRGAIYTIARVVDHSDDPLCEGGDPLGLSLVEVPDLKETKCFYADYWSGRFRPAVERKTDISIFTKMLTPNRELAETR
jgi:hypothetical protein